MEKFRKWADAPTGINPFPSACVFERSWMLTLLFPLRLALALVVVVALVVVEVVLHTARVSRIPVVGRVCLAPLLRVLGSAVLFLAAGGCSPVCRLVPPRTSSTSVPSGIGSEKVHHQPTGGDVVLCNAVSPWDLWLLLAAFDAEWSLTEGAVAVAWVDPRNRVVEPVVFGPSPFLRWRVWRHVWHVSSSAFLASACDQGHDDRSRDSASKEECETAVVDLSALHRRGKKLGVPLIVFPEGITSNGKAILRWPHPLRFAASEASPPNAPIQSLLGTVHIVAVSYGNDIVPLPFNEERSVLSYLFRCGTHASRTSGKPTCVSVARPSTASTSAPVAGTGAPGGGTEVTLGGTWTEECRQRMATLVQYRNSANNCRAVGVGLAQKCGFVQQWLAAGSTSASSATKRVD